MATRLRDTDVVIVGLGAVGGTAAFATGCLALRPPPQGEPPTFRVYFGALWLMVLFLVLVVALGIFVVSRLVNQPQPPFIPVPTVSTEFSVDGAIEQMGSNMWVVGGTFWLLVLTVIFFIWADREERRR